MEEIKDGMESKKELKRLKELFQCVIWQLEDCPLCRLSLPDAQIRKPMFVSGLATLLDIPGISMISALWEANLISPPQNEADDDTDVNDLLSGQFALPCLFDIYQIYITKCKSWNFCSEHFRDAETKKMLHLLLSIMNMNIFQQFPLDSFWADFFQKWPPFLWARDLGSVPSRATSSSLCTRHHG